MSIVDKRRWQVEMQQKKWDMWLRAVTALIGSVIVAAGIYIGLHQQQTQLEVAIDQQLEKQSHDLRQKYLDRRIEVYQNAVLWVLDTESVLKVPDVEYERMNKVAAGLMLFGDKTSIDAYMKFNAELMAWGKSSGQKPQSLIDAGTTFSNVCRQSIAYSLDSTELADKLDHLNTTAP